MSIARVICDKDSCIIINDIGSEYSADYTIKGRKGIFVKRDFNPLSLESEVLKDIKFKKVHANRE
jgi:hypothetical protein